MNSATSSLRPSGALFLCGSILLVVYHRHRPESDAADFRFCYQKLSIYTIDDRTVHLARQIGRTRDQCKLDISHALSGLEGKEYGNVVFETKNRRTRISLGVSAK